MDISYEQGPEIIQKHLDIQVNYPLNVCLKLTWQEVFQKISGHLDNAVISASERQRSSSRTRRWRIWLPFCSVSFLLPLSDAARASVAFSGTWAPYSSSKVPSLPCGHLATCLPRGCLPVCRAANLHAAYLRPHGVYFAFLSPSSRLWPRFALRLLWSFSF